MMYPMRLIPCYKEYLWGGGDLKKRFGKLDAPDVAAESWELACHPDGVSHISGGAYDGMTIQELGTIFQSKIPVKIVLLNNSFLGMVRQWQELFYDRRYSFTEMVNPDFGLIARGNGLSYRCVERREELDEAIAAMKASEGAFLLEVRVEGEENIFPMVPAGAPVSEIRFE